MTGDYVAVTAKRQPDNTLLASMINVFPASMKGVALGQRPMQGGNLMTNASIDKVDSGGFTVTFPGGGAQVKLASNRQISRTHTARTRRPGTLDRQRIRVTLDSIHRL